MLFSLAYCVTVCNINYIVNTEKGDFNNEHFTENIFSRLWSGCYQSYLRNSFYNSGNVREIMTMTVFLISYALVAIMLLAVESNLTLPKGYKHKPITIKPGSPW